MATILDSLQRVDYNFRRQSDLDIMRLAKYELHTVAILLEKGYSLDDDIDSILEEYGDVEDVPDCDEGEG